MPAQHRGCSYRGGAYAFCVCVSERVAQRTLLPVLHPFPFEDVVVVLCCDLAATIQVVGAAAAVLCAAGA